MKELKTWMVYSEFVRDQTIKVIIQNQTNRVIIQI